MTIESSSLEDQQALCKTLYIAEGIDLNMALEGNESPIVKRQLYKAMQKGTLNAKDTKTPNVR